MGFISEPWEFAKEVNTVWFRNLQTGFCFHCSVEEFGDVIHQLAVKHGL
jgi:hypothetical protein